MHISNILHKLDEDQRRIVREASLASKACFICIDTMVYYVSNMGKVNYYEEHLTSNVAMTYMYHYNETNHRPRKLSISDKAIQDMKHVAGAAGKVWSDAKSEAYIAYAAATGVIHHYDGKMFVKYKTYVLVIDNFVLTHIERPILV